MKTKFRSRIKKLSDPSHQFKVSKNAQQNGLTGICIINPNVSLVYVEGGSKGMKHYSRLMEHRIDWTQPARLREKGEDDQDSDEKDTIDIQPPADNTVDAAALAENRCDVLWQGLIAEHAFHSFKTVRAPTDNLAREQLGVKLASYWDTAKNWKPADEELYN
jgi:U4/U6 small nuclear ribonucleoprotein PRP3